jgi:hypothetical protein
LANVTSIGFVVYKKYYPSESDHSFQIKELRLIPENVPYSSTMLLENLMKIRPAEAQVEVLESEPTGSTIRLQTAEPVMLGDSESYDPLWKASITGSEATIYSQPNHYVSNGFLISEPGDYEIHIRYAPEDWLLYGGLITAITTGFVTAFLIKNRRQLNHYDNSQKSNTLQATTSQTTTSQINYSWSYHEEIHIPVDPRKHFVLSISNYLLILSLGLLAVLPYSTIFHVNESDLNNILMISYYLLLTGVVLKVSDYLLFAKIKRSGS